MKILEKGQRYIRKQVADKKIFYNNLNKDKSFALSGKDFMDPFNMIPKPLYEDFNRDKYKRHTLKFPINIPISYRHVYLPNTARRKVVRQPDKPNYASATGNQLLLSLSQYQDYTFQEILEMFIQLSNKPKANKLKLELNPLVTKALMYMDSNINGMKVNDLVKYLEAIDKLEFKKYSRYNEIKKNIIKKYPALKKCEKNQFSKCFLIIAKRFKLKEEEWEIIKEQTGRYLRKESPDYIYEMSKMLIDKKIVNHYSDYLFEYHMMMGFWKKMGHFKLKHINYFFEKLNEWQYYEFDPEFYIEEFLPMVKKKVVVCEDAEVIQETLRHLKDFQNSELIEEQMQKYIETTDKRLNFVRYYLPKVYSTRLVNMVQKDLEKFKRKQLKKKEEEKQTKIAQKKLEETNKKLQSNVSTA